MKMIQIRNVPDDVHQRLKEQAASSGRSLSDYLKEEVTRLAELPTMAEWVRMVRSRKRTPIGISGAELIRQSRAERWGD